MKLFPAFLRRLQFVSDSYVSVVPRPHPSFLCACSAALVCHYPFPSTSPFLLSPAFCLDPSLRLQPPSMSCADGHPVMVDTGEGNEALQTVAPRAPVTYERLVSARDLGILNPNAEHPNGTPGYKNNGYSVLQQHVAFFDLNKDGIIYPWETYAGFRQLGFGFIISFLAAVIINGALSYATLDSWIPSPLFPLYIKNIHKDKHGSDSDVYDNEGRFVPQKFEELFSKFAKIDKTKLYVHELYALTCGIRYICDPFGWTAAKLDWWITYMLLKDQGGFVCKEQVRGIYDGSLFETIAAQRQKSS